MRTFSNKNVSISFLRILLNLCGCLFAFPTKNKYALPHRLCFLPEDHQHNARLPKTLFQIFSPVPTPLKHLDGLRRGPQAAFGGGRAVNSQHEVSEPVELPCPNLPQICISNRVELHCQHKEDFDTSNIY